MTPPPRTISTTKLERELAAAKAEVARAEADLEEARKRRDVLVVRLRRHPDRPSARAIAELAGISAVWVLKLAEEPG